MITCVEIPMLLTIEKKKLKIYRDRGKKILNIITFTQNYIRIKKKTVNQLWYYCDLINVNNQGLNLGK